MIAEPRTSGDAWNDAYEEQATPAMMQRCLSVAQRCSQRIAAAGGVGGDLRARELVQDVLGDTLEGGLRWDPDRKTLESHVVDTLRWRTRNECLRGHQRVSLDAPSSADANGREEEPVYGEEEADREALVIGALPWGGAATPSEETERNAEKILRDLYHLARGDRDVQRLLRAYEHGACSTADVLAMVNLTTTAYRNARIRLARLAQRWTSETRASHLQRKDSTP